MIFHITVKNVLDSFIEQSEIQGITNLINDLENIELIGAWQDSLDFSFYFVIESESYELLFDLITSNISNKIVTINPVKSMDEVEERIKTNVSSLDVAELVAFLASSKSSKTTGAQIPIDGGNERII